MLFPVSERLCETYVPYTVMQWFSLIFKNDCVLKTIYLCLINDLIKDIMMEIAVKFSTAVKLVGFYLIYTQRKLQIRDNIFIANI